MCVKRASYAIWQNVFQDWKNLSTVPKLLSSLLRMKNEGLTSPKEQEKKKLAQLTK